MAANCGCSGVRSCRLCQPKPVGINVECNNTWMQCATCGRIGTKSTFSIVKDDLVKCKENTPCSEVGTYESEAVKLCKHCEHFSGILICKNFVSEEEESVLCRTVSKEPWVLSQSGRLKQVGLMFN